MSEDSPVAAIIDTGVVGGEEATSTITTTPGTESDSSPSRSGANNVRPKVKANADPDATDAGVTPRVDTMEAVAELRVVFGDGYNSKMLWFVGDRGALLQPNDVIGAPSIRITPGPHSHKVVAPAVDSTPEVTPESADKSTRFSITLSSHEVGYGSETGSGKGIGNCV